MDNVRLRFQDVVKKIHSTLVVAPTIPQVIPDSHYLVSPALNLALQLPATVPQTTTIVTTNSEDAMAIDFNDATATTSTATPADQAIDGATEEIPFVPASKRLARAEVDDSIVMVGQRQKKRKRDKTGTTDVSPAIITGKGKKTKKTEVVDEGAGGKEMEEDVTEPQPFDYSAALNILDDEPDVEEEGTRKRKKKQRKNNKGSSPIPEMRFPTAS